MEGFGMNIQAFWKATLHQDAAAMKKYFASNACVRWHNTNELFTADEFIKANCEYPNQWDGDIERLETINNIMITVVHVYSTNQPLSFHVTSFMKLENDKIVSIDEYWGDDGSGDWTRK